MRVTLEIINRLPEVAYLLFSRFIPFKAEIMPEGWIEYIGICDEFEERREGFLTPQYDAIIKTGEDGKYCFDKFIKVDG